MGEKISSRYSEELKAKIIAEYAKEELGYRKIAKKFGMTRDAVRGIILRSRLRKTDTIGEVDMKKISLKNPEIDSKNLDKETREYIENLKAKDFHTFNYSLLLNKKKQKKIEKKIKTEAIQMK